MFSMYLVWDDSFFSAAGFDWLLFRNRSGPQEERDLALLAITGAAMALLVFKVFDR